MKTKRIFNMKDAVLLGLLLIIAAAFFLIPNFKPQGNLTAFIIKDNQAYKIIKLNEVDDPYLINIDGRIPVIISVEKNCIYFKSSGCPDKICVNTGKLSKAGDMAVCLPAGVIIEVRGSEKEFDSITG